MRLALCLVLVACGGDKNAAIEEARAAAERESTMKEKARVPAPTIRPPVAGEAKLPCTQVIDLEAFGKALGETAPLVLKDHTQPKGDVAASCDLVRGGKPLSAAEQAARLKKDGRLGVMAGDTLCSIALYCYTFEDIEHFRRRCKERRDADDDSMGSYACRHVTQTGVYDKDSYRLFDEDTKCVFEVRGGPSNTDNDSVRLCAKTARDTIGPAQIAVK
jgi:hypothetical protein